MKYIPHEVNLLTEIFARAGHEIYMVGGCVRDMLMNIAPSDFDLATSALPEETKEILKDFKIIDTGIRHGTVTVYMGETAFEITTYRIESGYSDGRHPDIVSFTGKLSEDLSRRDFTINAMAMDYDGKVVDCFGGMEDIHKKKIRAVGLPEDRFREDALRVLRALRFSAKLGFDIEGETAKAIESNIDLLQNISRERIFEELSKLLASEFACRTIKKFYAVINDAILGERTTEFSKENSLHFADFLDEIYGKVEGEDIRFAAFLKMNNVENPDAVMKNLKVSKTFLNSVLDIIRCSQMMEMHFGLEEDRLPMAMLKYNESCVFKGYLLMDFCKNGNLSADAWNRIDEIKYLKETRCFELKNLDICGNDLKKIGIRGVAIGKWLNKILEEVALGKLDNNKSRIVDFMVKNI